MRLIRTWAIVWMSLASVGALADVCQWPGSRSVNVLQTPTPAALPATFQVREISDSVFLHQPGTPNTASYLEMREWISAHVNPEPFELLRRQRGVYVASRIFSGEVSHFDRVISGAVGVIGDISCLEALLLDEHTRRVPLSQAANEFIALVLSKEGRLRIYFISGDIRGTGPSLLYVANAIKSDLAQGWVASFHLHNHPFVFDNAYGDISGTTIPSSADANSYRSMVTRWGLREARVTNGVSTIRIPAAQFDAI